MLNIIILSIIIHNNIKNDKLFKLYKNYGLEYIN